MGATMRLTGQQFQQFTQALLDAFTYQRLTELVRFRLDDNLARMAMGDDLQEIVFKLIRTAEAEGWTDRLLLAARESNPGNPQLLAFSQQFGLAPATPPRPELERLIKQTNSFLDIAQWRRRLGEIEAQVCRVEIDAPQRRGFGTGFLLGPDVVMTNYHVMQPVIEGQGAQAEHVTLRFDYKRLEDGTTLNPGKTYRLAAEWLIDKSPSSAVDLQPEPKSGAPAPDELDYALLRTAGAPGHDPVGDRPDPESPPRKWVEAPAQPYAFVADTALSIVQHPQGGPLKLALDDDGVIGLNGNGTRVMYKTNTEPGSSGSPCFNSNWELVALHHSGDPNYSPGHQPAYNQGIPFAAILQLLQDRGHAS
ncbi:MAG: effector-associated domain EAD1-containing protein [Thermomicrobiales bacterium]